MVRDETFANEERGNCAVVANLSHAETIKYSIYSKI